MRKNAIVTGAGQGIGEAVAKQLAEEGYSVVVNDIDLKKAEETVKIIENDGFEAVAVQANIAESDQREELFEKAVKEFGEIDLLVNNAGIQTTNPFLELTEDEWDKVLDTNLKGTYFLSQLVANLMVDRDIEGDIVNISSIHQNRPRRNRNHYDASKAGIGMITKDVALELAEYNINVNCVAPGATKTPMNSDILESEEEIERYNTKIPLGRMGEPEEVAEAVCFLASKEANYITGSCLEIDGGSSLTRKKGG
jgi:glucose 1-dehydrogenase